MDRHDHRLAGGEREGSGLATAARRIANAPVYQLWLSAVGLQPQSNPFYDLTYPWFGFRVGVGDLKPAGR